MQIEAGNNRLEMQSMNNNSLVEELDKLLAKLRMPPEVFPFSLCTFVKETLCLCYMAYLSKLWFLIWFSPLKCSMQLVLWGVHLMNQACLTTWNLVSG